MGKAPQFRDRFILGACEGKTVLHIGATNAPDHLERIRNNALLHKSIERISRKAIGTDIAKEAIEDLKTHGVTSILHHSIEDPFPPKIRNETFDIIVFSDVIEHLSNPGLALQRIKSVMSKETTLLLTTVNTYAYFNFFNFFRKEHVNPDHTFWASRRTMERLFALNGLEPFEFRYLSHGTYESIRTFKGRFWEQTAMKIAPKYRTTIGFKVRLAQS